MSNEIKQGWACPINSRKFHYFRNSRSICGRWMFFGPDLDDSADEHKENCVACQKKKLKEGAE